MTKTEQKKQWHMGFYGAIELEFRDDKEVLDFHREYQLSKKPLSMDMLVVKKNCDKALHNDIGKIFKGHNIIEYKSPKDMLGIDQFYKGLSYACLYKSLGKYADEIKIEEVTLSFVRGSYPRELFKRLQELEHNVTRKYPGVYYVTNKLMIPIQIIVTKELELEEHISLRMLSDNVTEQNAKRFVETASLLIEKDDRANADAILQISVSANKTIYDKVKEEEAMCDALRDLMKDEIEEEVKEKTTKAVVEERISIIRTQMKNLKWSAEKVMESMGIPKSEYPNYMKML